MLNVVKRKEEGLKIITQNKRFAIDTEDLQAIRKEAGGNWVDMINTAFYIGLVQGRKIGRREERLCQDQKAGGCM